MFPDGSEFLDAPVLAWDLLGDLAVIGPLETATSPAELADGEHLEIGADVFAIGYPDGSVTFPRPAIWGGLASRVLQWEAADMTFFESDASIAGGEVVILVSRQGAVIGVTSPNTNAARLNFVASGVDVAAGPAMSSRYAITGIRARL